MLFKDDDIKKQFHETKIHPGLVLLLEGLDSFCKKKAYPEILVTDVNTPGVHGKNSDHYATPCRAVDLRAKHLTAEQLAHMDNYVTENFPRKGIAPKGYQLRAFYAHGEDANFHIHLSCDA